MYTLCSLLMSNFKIYCKVDIIPFYFPLISYQTDVLYFFNLYFSLQVPVHLRAGWQAFYLEMITLVGILVYAANFFTGKSKNSKLATAWYSHCILMQR